MSTSSSNGTPGKKESLALSEEVRRSFLQTASLPLWAVDATGRLRYVNPYLAEYLQVPLDLLEGLNLMTATTGQDRTILRTHLDQVINQKESARCEIEVTMPDASRRYLRFMSQVGAESSGMDPVCWSSVEDQTHSKLSEKLELLCRRSAELAMKATSLPEFGKNVFEQLRLLMNIKHGCLVLKDDVSGRLHYIISNPAESAGGTGAFDELVQYVLSCGRMVWRRELQSGSPWLSLVVDAASGAPTDFLALPLHENGRICGVFMAVNHAGAPVFDPREVDMLMGLSHVMEISITRWKSQSNESRLAAAIDQVADSVIISSADGRLEYVNPAFERASGYACAEVLGKPLSMLKSGKHGRDFYRSLWNVLNAGGNWRGRFVNRRKDGELIEVESVICPVRHANGEVRHYVAVQRIVDGDSEARSSSGLSMELEAVNRLIASFSHDLRNILLTIRANADSLLKHERNQASAEPLNQIQHASDQAETLLNEWALLASNVGRNREAVDVNRQIIRFEPLVRKILGEDRPLSLDLSPRLLPIRVQPGEVEQLLTQLLLLAIRMTPESSNIVIRTSSGQITEADLQVFLDAPIPGSRPYVIMECSCVGFATELDTERLRAVRAGEKIAGKSAVLLEGLRPLMARLRHHYGHVALHQSSGSTGGSICLYLPADPVAHVPAAATESPAVHLDRGHETVLLAEDDPGARRVMARMLEDQGYSVIEAENGATAIRSILYHEGKIDLLLTDIIMPDFDGRALAEQISSLKPEIKVVYTSGYDLAELEARGILVPGQSLPLVKKPFRREELLGVIRQSLDGH